jgi:hypothetical protein
LLFEKVPFLQKPHFGVRRQMSKTSIIIKKKEEEEEAL